MKKIIKEGHELKRFTLPRNEAIQFMEEREEPYKVELIRDLPGGCGDFLLRPGRICGSVRRPASDDDQRDQGVQADFLFHGLLERRFQ